MSNKCPTCSQPGTERSNPQGEARGGEPVSRNASELVPASLNKVEAANLPDVLKPATASEATLMCSWRASRGERRQRAGKEKSRNLRDPAVGDKVGVVHRCRRRESDGPIVVKNGLTRAERRRSTVSVQPSKPNATA
jgi:hypothetical protein